MTSPSVASLLRHIFSLFPEKLSIQAWGLSSCPNKFLFKKFDKMTKFSPTPVGSLLDVCDGSSFFRGRKKPWLFVRVNRSEETTRKRVIGSEMGFWLVQPGMSCSVPSADSSVQPHLLGEKARRWTNLRPCLAPGSAHLPAKLPGKVSSKMSFLSSPVKEKPLSHSS